MAKWKGTAARKKTLTSFIILAAIILITSNSLVEKGKCAGGDCINGSGIIEYKFATYEGKIQNGRPHGRGVLTLINGSGFTGSFMNGKRHGYGIFVFADGSKYVGEWSHNRMNGLGTFTFADGETYSGTWKDGMMHGRGALVGVDGIVYVGEFYCNDKHGKGMEVTGNGEKKIGFWESDRYIGEELERRSRAQLMEHMFI